VIATRFTVPLPRELRPASRYESGCIEASNSGRVEHLIRSLSHFPDIMLTRLKVIGKTSVIAFF
jgi:hypothetical protein